MENEAVLATGWGGRWVHARDLWMRTLPHCGESRCTLTRRLWRRLRWWNASIGLQGTRYCAPQCFENAMGQCLGRILTATVPATAVRHRIPLGLLLLSRGQLTHPQLRSALEAQKLKLGFDVANVAMLRLDLPEARYRTPEQVRSLVDRLGSALSGEKSGRHVGVASSVPVLDGPATDVLAVEGETAPPDRVPTAARMTVDAGFFDALGLRVPAGRAFAATDGPGAEPVAIVSRSLASRHFQQRDPIGRRIQLGPRESGAPWRTIVGVADDVQNANPGEPPLAIVYVPLAQETARSLVMFVRTQDTGPVLASARAELARLDPEQPLYDAKTLAQAFDEQLVSDRIIAGMFLCFAGVALVLAIVGLYAIISYTVSQRTREFGVRVALGASRGDVVRLVVTQGLRLTSLGVVLGLLAGGAMARAVAGALYGVSATDPVTFSAVTLALLATAAVASVAPAWRAARMDPIRALHEG